MTGRYLSLLHVGLVSDRQVVCYRIKDCADDYFL
jgi:hypothetical protein